MTGQPYEYPSADDNAFRPVDPYGPSNQPQYPQQPHYPPPSYPPPSYPPPSYPPPSYPPPQQPPAYPPPYPGAGGYQAPAPYADPYNPYQSYPNPSATNGLAIASLITSIAGFVLALPLTFLCLVGEFPLPIIGIVLGIVGLNQVNKNQQQGRGMAIAGIAVGAATLVLCIIGLVVFVAAIRSH